MTAESKDTLGEMLFEFLLSVRDGGPLPRKLIVADEMTLREIYADPHPDLREALRHCVDQFLVEVSHDPSQWGGLEVPAWSLGVAIALNNCLVLRPQQRAGADFTSALIATLPPARRRDEAFIYHAVLRGSLTSLGGREPEAAGNLRALIERSPLTALWTLDEYTPVSLLDSARALIPGRHAGRPFAERVWQSDEEWLVVLSLLLADARISRWVRHRWLVMPESRRACRNVGLVLEALRRRGDQRAFILEFYEAYDYFRAQVLEDEWAGNVRAWPVLKSIQKLLLVPGNSEAALQMNRRGNEMFLKFRPLVEMVISEGVLPKDYRLLTLGFVLALRPLLPYVTEAARPAISFGEVAFGE